MVGFGRVRRNGQDQPGDRPESFAQGKADGAAAIKDRVRERLGVRSTRSASRTSGSAPSSAAPWSASDRGKALELIDDVVRVAMSAGGAQIVGDREDRDDVRRAQSVPFAPIDDRTGAGDKAQGAATTGSPSVARRGGEAMSGERKQGSARKTRVEHGMRDALTEMIAADIKDPRVHAPTTADRGAGRAQRRHVGRALLRLDRRRRRDRRRGDRRAEQGRGLPARPARPRLSLQHAPELRFLLDRVDRHRARSSRRSSARTRSSARAAGRDVEAEKKEPKP